MKGYFRVHRRILDSQVFAHQTALKIWIWCLAKVNYRERFVPFKIGRGEICVNLKPGQFLFGRFKAEEELNIDGSTIYKWMQKFASEQFDNMIKIESNNQYSIVTVNNWDEYQNNEDNIITTEEQPSDKQVTTKEQPKNTDNKDKKEKNKRIKKGFIAPTLDEFKQYFLEKGYREDVAVRAWTGYNEANWFDSKGNPVLNWKQKVNNVWFSDENKITARKDSGMVY